MILADMVRGGLGGGSLARPPLSATPKARGRRKIGRFGGIPRPSAGGVMDCFNGAARGGNHGLAGAVRWNAAGINSETALMMRSSTSGANLVGRS